MGFNAARRLVSPCHPRVSPGVCGVSLGQRVNRRRVSEVGSGKITHRDGLCWKTEHEQGNRLFWFVAFSRMEWIGERGPLFVYDNVKQVYKKVYAITPVSVRR